MQHLISHIFQDKQGLARLPLFDPIDENTDSTDRLNCDMMNNDLSTRKSLLRLEEASWYSILYEDSTDMMMILEVILHAGSGPVFYIRSINECLRQRLLSFGAPTEGIEGQRIRSFFESLGWTEGETGRHLGYLKCCTETLDSITWTDISPVVGHGSLHHSTTIRPILDSNRPSQYLLVTTRLLEPVNAKLLALKKIPERPQKLSFGTSEIIYASEVFSDVLRQVRQVAATNATVLLQGETGTGKELVAQAIHQSSLRKNKPMIKINCSAIPKELLESELFGHTKGAFTGAHIEKPGKFLLADGGTLFLDEVGEMPLELQPKILRALQEGEIEKVGGGEPAHVDVRIISATNKDLVKESKKKRFRADLFYRLNVFPIVIPPLRERNADIPVLIEFFVRKFSRLYQKKIDFIAEDAWAFLLNHPWPGNVRELANSLERAVIKSGGDSLHLTGFTPDNRNKRSIRGIQLTLDQVQRNHILTVLKSSNWVIEGKQGAAQKLDIKPSTLRDKMKRLSIKRPPR